jgi:hypothetical protein
VTDTREIRRYAGKRVVGEGCPKANRLRSPQRRPDELPLDADGPCDPVDHERIAGGDRLRLLDAVAPKNVSGVRVADVLGEGAAEEDGIPLDQGVDELLVGPLVPMLLRGVGPALEEDKDVHAA